ncbi:MAG: filamentous hemagglutinin N-terminal domain-containing protein, partial [Alphaproteobacteria bacterium]|nr:filamentous hemagglutinin N-terminal domain-containing protein [Alphaproteobacteria bacterium]
MIGRLGSLVIRYIGMLAFIWVQLIVPTYAITNIAIINKSGSNTHLQNAANGIPIININKVDGNGHSINEYDVFDVGSGGIIFNNSSDLSNTQLAGWIVGNTNLKSNQNATLILNTVKSKRSELGGYMEVAGNKADIIILNSNGIVCDGCGFINTNRAVLSTGEGQFSNGNFAGISIGRGEVEIGRGGLNAGGANRLDILSQQLRLNGVIQGHDVNIHLGGSDYNYNSGVASVNANNNNTQYVISSNEFGGMYGDSIRLVSYNKSVGVNIDFNMATAKSSLSVDAAGNLIVSGKLSSADSMSLRGANVEVRNTSELTAKQSLSLKGDSLNFVGSSNSNSLNLDFNSIYTDKISYIQSNTININAINLGKFDGKILGVNVNFKGSELNFVGEVGAESKLNVDGKQVNISGSVSGGDITLSGGSLDVWGRLIAQNGLNLNSNNIYFWGGSITQGKAVNINANNLDLKRNSSITSMGDFFIKLAGDFNLNAGVMFAANNNLSLAAYNINLYAGADLSSNGKMSISGNNLYVGIGNSFAGNNNQKTKITSKGDLSIDVSGESNIQVAGNVVSSGLLSFRSKTLTNRGFIAGQDIAFKVDYLSNLGKERIGSSDKSYADFGIIYGIDSINIEGYNGGNAKKIVNSSSKIQTLNKDINISAESFENILTWWDIFEDIGKWTTVYEKKFLESVKVCSSGFNYICDFSKKYETLKEKETIYTVYGANGAYLSSGGNLNITGGSFLNRSSIVSAVGKININAGFKNETVVSPKDNYKEYESYTYEMTPIFGKKECYTSGGNSSQPGGGGGGSQYCDTVVGYEKINEKTTSYTESTGKTAFSQAALITAGGTITINSSGGFCNGNSIQCNTHQNIDNNINYETGNSINKENGIDLNFVDGNMFYESDGTNGYLIETNPDFTDLQKFKGSKYYLHLLGLDRDDNNNNDLILGDGFVDLEVVGNQIFDNTGKEILEGYTNKEEQLEGLMEAGIEAKDELGLVLGEALTEEQLGKLKQPIIWWVRKVINGQNVLVPQVFFPTDYKTNKPQGGATISGGGGVNIDVEGDMENGGNISSGGDIDINVGGNLNNSGNINGNGLVDIDVDGNMDNSGNIHGDDGVSIDVGGDFNNSGSISDANNGEEHQNNMNDMANNINNNIDALEDMQNDYENSQTAFEESQKSFEESQKAYEDSQKSYEYHANQYKQTEDLYNAKATKYEELLAKYSAIKGSEVKNKYAGKVWSGDIKQRNAQEKANTLTASEIADLEAQLSSLAAEMEPLAESLKTQGDSLNKEGESLNKAGESLNKQGESLNQQVEELNAKGEELNNFADNIKQQIEDLNNYVDNIHGIEINVGGDFTQNGTIEGNKILAEVGGKFESIEGSINTTFKASINAKEITLVGANISSNVIDLNANEINLFAAEKRNSKGYVSELVSSNISGGSVNLNANGDIYISSSNIMGNTINLEAGNDITITGQAIEHELGWDDLKNETVSYTNINNPNEVIEGKAEDVAKNGNFNISGKKEEHVGSNIVASESLTMSGNDITILGSTIYSDGLLAIDAKDTLSIGVLEDHTSIDYDLSQSKTEKHGAWHSKKKTITKIEDNGSIDYTHNVGSTIVGDSVYLGAGKDVNIKGSVIANTDRKENSPSSGEGVDTEGGRGSGTNDSTEGEATEIKTPPAWEDIGSGEIIINAGNDVNITGAEDKRDTSLSTSVSITEMKVGFSTIADNAKGFGNALKDHVKTYGDAFTSKEGALNHINSGANTLGAFAGMTNVFSVNGQASTTTT